MADRSALRDLGFGPDNLETVLDLLPQEAAVLDRDFAILWQNRTRRALLPDLAAGMKCHGAFGLAEPCPFCLAREVRESHRPLKNPVCVMAGPHKNSPRHVTVTLAPVRLADDREGFVEIVDNVEELYRDRRELERLNDEYENVIYALSHDLRSPLVSVEGFLRKIRQAIDAGDGPVIAHCLERLHANSSIMNRLVTELLDTSRVVTGLLNLAETDMEKLARETADHWQALAAEQGARIVLRGVFGVERCDRVRIGQVYSNLVGNALKHCRGTPRLEIELGADKRVYRVRDNGPGIPAALVDRVFEPFTRGDKKGKESFGMGMNIVYRIMQKHGGDLWIDSAPGRGTTVFFSFQTDP